VATVGRGVGMNRPRREWLGDVFMPLYARVFGDDSEFARSVETKLDETLREDPVERFLSVALAYGVVLGLTLWILGVLLGLLIIVGLGVTLGGLVNVPWPSQQFAEAATQARTPLFIGFVGLVFGSIGFAIGFGTPVGYLWVESGGRQREIDVLLPDAVAFMYALSIGGLNQLEIIEAIADAEEVYGEVSREFQVILNETGYFDTDYRTAIRNRSIQTPSDEFAQFLTDMLSILSSGGDMTEFLDQKKDKHMRSAKQSQEATLETLQLFGEMYLTLSLFPLLLIILLVTVSLMSGSKPLLMAGTVYLMIPILSVAFLVLISTVKQDDPGDGRLEAPESEFQTQGSMLERGPIEEFADEGFSVFEEIQAREGLLKAIAIVRHPIRLFHERPETTLAVTVPLTAVMVAVAVASGLVPLSLDGFIEHYYVATAIVLYLPIYAILGPFAVFYVLNSRRKGAITNDLTDSLRKLSSANDTGLTLLESFGMAADTSSGRLAREFDAIRGKVTYGKSMKQALVEFNNEYAVPRLARIVKLISEAQEASSQITDVLTTAAQASENQDDLEREQATGARMQMVIIIMSFMTMLGVMAILKVKFLGPMAELAASASGGGGGGSGGSDFGGAVNVQKLSMYFFHAVTIQAIAAGMISGYMRSGKLLDGLKFVVVLVTFPLLVWLFI